MAEQTEPVPPAEVEVQEAPLMSIELFARSSSQRLLHHSRALRAALFIAWARSFVRGPTRLVGKGSSLTEGFGGIRGILRDILRHSEDPGNSLPQ